MRIIAMGVALFAGVALLGPQPAWAQAARWSVDGSGVRCTLARSVGGTEPVTLILRTVPSTGKHELMLVKKDRWGRPRSPFEDIRVTFKPSGKVHERRVQATDLGAKNGKGIGAQSLPSAFFEDFAQSEGFDIETEGRLLGTFSYPDAHKAAEAVDLCIVAKLIEWGADPAGLENGAQRPKPLGDAIEWLLGEDGRKGLGGGLHAGAARLHLDTEGRVEACELLEGTKDRVASSACARLEAAARYEPARDKAGNAVKSVVVETWDLMTAMEVRAGSFRP